ncbi:hypothetical protein TNCV_3154921 [Trichonephila clavipes]|nr:hypothetical protein TNCV_3154921 [Trichonephila clavipes]
MNLEVHSDDIQELLDSHNQVPIVDKLIEMYVQEQDIEESLDPFQLEDRMTVGKLREVTKTRRHGTTPLRVKEDIEDVSSKLGNGG